MTTSTATIDCPAWCDRHHWTRPHRSHYATLLDDPTVGFVSVDLHDGGAPIVHIHPVRAVWPPWTSSELFAFGDALAAAGGLLEHIAKTLRQAADELED